MNSQEIDQKVRGYDYVLPIKLYSAICTSGQVDHVKRDGNWIDIWTKDGWYWRVTIKL